MFHFETRGQCVSTTDLIGNILLISNQTLTESL